MLKGFPRLPDLEMPQSSVTIIGYHYQGIVQKITLKSAHETDEQLFSLEVFKSLTVHHKGDQNY